jgi:hypothetical protein
MWLNQVTFFGTLSKEYKILRPLSVPVEIAAKKGKKAETLRKRKRKESS